MTAQQQAKTAPQATTWDIDPAHSSAEFEVRHLGISFVTGRFKGLRGSIALDEARPETARIEAEIDAATVDSGVPPRDDHLRSPDFFDVAAHPVLRFASKRVEAMGNEGVVVGDLTIRGVTREVPLRVERTGEVRDPWGKRRVGVRAEATLALKDFGLTWNQPLEGGGFVLGDKVQVTLRVEGVQRAPEGPEA